MKDNFIYLSSWALTLVTASITVNDILSIATACGSLAVSFTGIYLNLRKLKNQKNENTI